MKKVIKTKVYEVISIEASKVENFVKNYLNKKGIEVKAVDIFTYPSEKSLYVTLSINSDNRFPVASRITSYQIYDEILQIISPFCNVELLSFRGGRGHCIGKLNNYKMVEVKVGNTIKRYKINIIK